jgi:hypothetical protein
MIAPRQAPEVAIAIQAAEGGAREREGGGGRREKADHGQGGSIYSSLLCSALLCSALPR